MEKWRNGERINRNIKLLITPVHDTGSSADATLAEPKAERGTSESGGEEMKRAPPTSPTSPNRHQQMKTHQTSHRGNKLERFTADMPE